MAAGLDIISYKAEHLTISTDSDGRRASGRWAVYLRGRKLHGGLSSSSEAQWTLTLYAENAPADDPRWQMVAGKQPSPSSDDRIMVAEVAIREAGFALRYVQYCEDADTPGLLGSILGATNHERKLVKVATHRRCSAEIASTLEHELRHVEDPEWDCGSRDALGRGRWKAQRTAERFGAYHRVSDTSKRDTESESYITEREAFDRMSAWAKQRGVRIERRYLDRDVSGSKLERPALSELMEDLRTGRIDGVVVAYVDRLSRADVGDALMIVREIVDEIGAKFAALDLGVDPTTEGGELLLTVLLALARMQWRRFRSRWESARASAVERGAFVGPTPLGYRRDSAGRLEPHPELGPIVREAFERAASESLHGAMGWLREQLPEQRWTSSDTRRVLASRAYLGESVSGELVNRHAHAPLVTLPIWTAAQTQPRQRARSGEYPLSGIARCAGCGGALVGHLQTVQGRRYRRYRCSNMQNGHSCPAPTSISADKLEGWVTEQLKAGLAGDQIRVSSAPGELEDARSALEIADAQLASYAADVELREALGPDAFLAGARERRERLDQARERYQDEASRVAHIRTLPAADELDDPDKLAAALEAVSEIPVARGARGASISDRARIAWNDGDDAAGMLAA